MTFVALSIPEKPFLVQRPMLRVSYALLPLLFASIYLFGWRAFALTLAVAVFGLASEALFTFREGKPVTSAALVTCLIFSLSLPSTIPFWMAVVGIVFGIGLGKMAFGGFGQNVFNPAMVGRCFLYVTFPIPMTNRWTEPLWGGLAGFSHWSPTADALTRATPLVQLKEGILPSLKHLLMGNTAGSMGETCALLIVLGGAYILYKKAAPWRIALSCLLGAVLLSALFWLSGLKQIPNPLYTLLSGSFLFGCAFVATEPVSGAKTRMGQWIYGFLIGGLTVVLRGFSNFSEGVMFAVLLMNAFVPALDQTVQTITKRRSRGETTPVISE